MVILLGDAAEILKDFNDSCIDLTVTSPPYDNLRTYGGYTFNFEAIAKQLYRVTNEGGVVVWVTGDKTTDWDESGTSFKQALYFKKIGFKLYDTLIYAKNGASLRYDKRYFQIFEYMFILSKGKLNTFNPLEDRKNITSGTTWVNKSNRLANGKQYIRTPYTTKEYGLRYNIWYYNVGAMDHNYQHEILKEHPAIFPDKLAQDHIKSWSNEGDLILDPFAGSGTTLKAAHQLRRKWIGIEINPDYVQLAKKRLTPYVEQQRLEEFIT